MALLVAILEAVVRELVGRVILVAVETGAVAVVDWLGSSLRTPCAVSFANSSGVKTRGLPCAVK